MRPLMAFVLVTLSLTGIASSTPLDTQIVLPGGDSGDSASIRPHWSYENCGSLGDSIQIDSIVVTPDPPKPGQDLTVKVIATAQERVEEGAYAKVAVKLGLIKILTKDFDLCEEARNANTSVQCPVEPGPYTVQHTVSLPKEIPRAKFNVDVKGYTSDDDDMFCLKLIADFTTFPFARLW